MEDNIIRTSDKLKFTTTVANLILAQVVFTQFPQFFKYYYLAVIIPLMVNRFITFKSQKKHYLLIDLCYFTNVIILMHAFVWPLGPSGQWMFETVFVLGNGPILTSILAFRNSLVFHRWDMSTSLLIHLLPSMYTYIVRWKTTEYYNFDDNFYLPMTLKQWFLFPTLMWWSWQSFYLFKTELIDGKYLLENPTFATTLRLNATNPNKLMTKLSLQYARKLKLIGYKDFFDANALITKCVFICSYFIYFTVSILPTKLYYDYWYTHLTAIFVMFLVASYNGANYYIEKFSKDYNKQFQTSVTYNQNEEMV